jgi:putative ABC transport system permease protein
MLIINPGVGPGIIVCAIIVGVLSGVYPALFLSAFNPVKILKGMTETGKNNVTFRNMLVVGQFTCAVFLMIATVFVVRQLTFMQRKDPGFNKDQIVSIPLDGVTSPKFDLIKNEFLKNSLILGVTASLDNLGSHLEQTNVDFKYRNDPLRKLISSYLVVGQS